MKIIRLNLNSDYSDVIFQAITVLERGGVIVCPTDTVYGLAANACDWNAVEQLFKIKKRPMTKPIAVLARNMKWVREIAIVPAKLEDVLSKIWPGAVTVLLPKKKIIPAIVTAKLPNVGVRIPDFPFLDKLFSKFGYPLAATSANMSGEEATGNINKMVEVFKNEVWKPDLILDAGNLQKSAPSTILDLSKIKPKVLRVGPSKPEQLMKLLRL